MSDIQEQLAQLGKQYAKKLVPRLNTIKTSIESLACCEEPRLTPLKELYKVVHKIHGTAGSYGFEQISLSMGKMEKILLPMIAFAEQHDTSNWSDEEKDGLAFHYERACSDPAYPDHLREQLERFGVQEAKANDANEGNDDDSVTLNVPLVPSASSPSVPGMIQHDHDQEWRPLSILVVDDDEDVLHEIAFFAKQTLNQVHLARSTEEALTIASEHAIDGALIDVHIATLRDGFQLARQLRTMNGYGSLPVAFISSDTRTANRIEASRTDAFLFLSKPVGANDFQFAINQLVSSQPKDPPRVLLLDNEDTFVLEVTTYLESKGLQVTSAQNTSDFMNVVERNKPDIVVINVDHPDSSGIDLCRMLRTSQTWQHIPILFVAEKNNLTTRLECFRVGGDDYMSKPIVLEELATRMEMRLDRSRLLRLYADIDPLTGLLNRRAMIHSLQRRIAEAKRNQQTLTLVLLDIDHFKQVNDVHGHLTGDQVLANLGRLLSRRFRREDLCSRWGGEEFCLSFYNQSLEDTYKMMARLLEEFSKLEFMDAKQNPFQVTFSAGMALYPDQGTSIEDLLKLADKALYKAKDAGRQRVFPQPDPS